MRLQHEAAEDMAAGIMARVASYRDEYDALAIAVLLGKLNALLRVHFAFEDTVLYPELMAGGDGEAARLAHKFHDEMGALAFRFEDFIRRWYGPTLIATSFEEFRDEAMAIFAALGARIERENDQLFPVAERATKRAA